MIKRMGLWGFVVAGLAVAAWGVVSWAAPSTSCRGIEMGPGDVCEYSSLTNERGGKVQRYEDRIAVARQQAPFASRGGPGHGGLRGGGGASAAGHGCSDIGP